MKNSVKEIKFQFINTFRSYNRSNAVKRPILLEIVPLNGTCCKALFDLSDKSENIQIKTYIRVTEPFEQPNSSVAGQSLDKPNRAQTSKGQSVELSIQLYTNQFNNSLNSS